MKYFIYNYSSFNNWTIESETSNISNIVDKLLRLTTKITESYAGDIVCLIDALIEAVEDEMPFEKLIAFREGGVSWYNPQDEGTVVDFGGNLNGIQLWYLKHVPENNVHCKTVLRRVMAKSDQAFATYIGG